MCPKEIKKEPVCIKELEVPVLVAHFSEWVTNLCKRFQTTEDDMQLFIEKRNRIIKYLQDELIPLSYFCQHYTLQHPGMYIRYYPGSQQSFDAKILDSNKEDFEKLEVTLADFGYEERIRNELLLKFGCVPLYSTFDNEILDIDGEVTTDNFNHKSKRYELLSKFGCAPEYIDGKPHPCKAPELEVINANIIVDKCIEKVRAAVEKKIKKSESGKYKDCNLIVAFDDFCLLSEEHFAQTRAEFFQIKTCFPVVYYVGLTGRLFLKVSSLG